MASKDSITELHGRIYALETLIGVLLLQTGFLSEDPQRLVGEVLKQTREILARHADNPPKAYALRSIDRITESFTLHTLDEMPSAGEA